MKLPAQIGHTAKFVLMMVIFSVVVFISYSLEKKIISNVRGVNASQGISYLQ